jgi:branched-subunit amino acid aminotransferase/4-amino-4-deoxychorismate lyase
MTIRSLYLQVTRGSRDACLSQRHAAYSVHDDERAVVALRRGDRQRGIGHHSSGQSPGCAAISSDRAAAQRADAPAAVDAGATEAILLRDGYLTEGAASNIFIVRDGTIITPPKSTCCCPERPTTSCWNWLDRAGLRFECAQSQRRKCATPMKYG